MDDSDSELLSDSDDDIDIVAQVICVTFVFGRKNLFIKANKARAAVAAAPEKTEKVTLLQTLQFFFEKYHLLASNRLRNFSLFALKISHSENRIFHSLWSKKKNIFDLIGWKTLVAFELKPKAKSYSLSPFVRFLLDSSEYLTTFKIDRIFYENRNVEANICFFLKNIFQKAAFPSG